MPRIARIIVPDCPHHIIQRGNRRQKVFFQDSDRELYIQLLKRQGEKSGISFWAYCLMDNHVHMIAVPNSQDSFAKGIGEAHRKYTNMINIRENWKGYLWQGRFMSYPLDEHYLYAAIRYVERNPVRAGIVQKAEDYSWSSAKAHVLRKKDLLLSDCFLTSEIKDWSSFLKPEDEKPEVTLIRDHELSGRPLGNEKFIQKLEEIAGRILSPRRQGRRKKEMGIVSPKKN